MPKRKRRKYQKPKRPFDKVRIKEEDSLVRKYGLKNKKEIWKAEAAVNKIRKQAKFLLTRPEEQEKFMSKLQKQGFKIESTTDILALDKENYLKRRLQSVVVEKKIATTPRQARQFINHKHITVDNKIVNVPSYIVPVDEEDKISLILVKKEKPAKTEKIKEAKIEAEVKNA